MPFGHFDRVLVYLVKNISLRQMLKSFIRIVSRNTQCLSSDTPECSPLGLLLITGVSFFLIWVITLMGKNTSTSNSLQLDVVDSSVAELSYGASISMWNVLGTSPEERADEPLAAGLHVRSLAPVHLRHGTVFLASALLAFASQLVPAF